MLSALSTVFNQAWAYSAIKEDKSVDRDSFSNMMFHRITSIQLIITCGLIATIKPILSIYVSKPFFVAWRYTPYLLVGFFFMSLGTFLSTSYLVNKDSKGFLVSGCIGAGINIVLNWLLIPQIGVPGAAIATCFSYFSVFLYRAYDTKKYIAIKFNNLNNVLATAMLLIMSVTLLVIDHNEMVYLSIEFIVVLVLLRKTIVDCITTAYKMLKTKNR